VNISMKLFFFSIIIFGVQIACSQKNPAFGKNARKTIYVADHSVECRGLLRQRCLLIKDSKDDVWQTFFHSINGFDYKPGYEYKLKIEERPHEFIRANAADRDYFLVEVLAKVRTEEKSEKSHKNKKNKSIGSKIIKKIFG